MGCGVGRGGFGSARLATHHAAHRRRAWRAGASSDGIRRGRGVSLDLVRVPNPHPTSPTIGAALRQASSLPSLFWSLATTPLSSLVSNWAMSGSLWALHGTAALMAVSVLLTRISRSRAWILLWRCTIHH